MLQENGTGNKDKNQLQFEYNSDLHYNSCDEYDDQEYEDIDLDDYGKDDDFVEDYPEYMAASPSNQQDFNQAHYMFGRDQQEMISLSNRSPAIKSPTTLTNQESPLQAQKVNNLNAQLICGRHEMLQANNRGEPFPQQVNANIIEDVNGSILQNIDLEGDDYSDVNFEDEQEELEDNNNDQDEELLQEHLDVHDTDYDEHQQQVLSDNTSNQKLMLQFKSFDAQPQQNVNQSGIKQISVSQSIQNGSSFKEAPEQMAAADKDNQVVTSGKSPITQLQKKNSSTNRHFTVSRKHSKMHKTPNQKQLPQMNNLDMLAASYNHKMETRRLNHKAKLQMQQQHQKSSNKKKRGHGLTGIQSQIIMPKEKSIWVDTLVIGSGPAALGFLVNALKTGRLNDLIRSKDNGYQNNMGLAIIDQGISFGGGQLGNYGINSNTSAGGFLKCISKATKKKDPKNLQMGPLNQLLKDISKNHHQNLEHIQRNVEKGLVGHRVPQTQKINSRKTGDLKKNHLEAGSFQKLGVLGNAAPFVSQQTGQPADANPAAAPPQADTLSAFKDLAQSKIYKTLKDTYGKSIVPLSMIGHFLNYVGNWILHHIYLLYSNQERACRIFYPMHKAEHIQLMSNGDVLTRVQKRNFYIQNGEQKAENEQREMGEYEMTVLENGTKLFVQKEAEIIYFRSKSVILANGGKQILHPEFFNWFPDKKAQESKVITSDYFLKRVGFLETMQKLAVPQPKKKKIVIVGGSHSGFSCAWLLLNGASSFEISMKELGHDGKSKPYPLHAQKKFVQNCQSCCKCTSSGKTSMMNKQPQSCKICVCKCFGYFQFQDWKAREQLKPLDFENEIESVSILHREDIKVFYKRVQDAEADNYKNFKKTDFQNQNGYLYSFTGLRGDAKELYKQVSNGTEKRLKLVQAKTVEEQTPYINEADLVIWACGYQTNFIPIYDMALQFQSQQCQMKPQQPLILSQRQPGTQFDVDNKCRLLLSNGIILAKIFACGIGYPVKTNDGKTMQPKLEGVSSQEKQILMKIQKSVNPRADSFSLYMNIVADLLIKNILPKDKKISKLVTHKIYPPNLCLQPQHLETQISSPFKIVKEQSKSLKPQIQQILPHRGQIDLKKMIAPQQVQLRLSTGSQFQSDQKLQIAPSNLNATTNLIEKRKANAKNRQGRQSKSQNRGTRLDKLHKFMPVNTEKTERPTSKALHAQPIVLAANREEQQPAPEQVPASQPKIVQNLDEYKIVCHSVVHADQKPAETVDHKKSRENIQQSQAQSLSSIGTRLIPHTSGLSQLNFTQQQQRFISKSPYITDQIKTIDQDKFKKVKKSRKDANKQRRQILKDSRNDHQSDSIHEGQVVPTAHIQLNKRKSQETSNTSHQQTTIYHQSKSQSQIFSAQSHSDQAQFQTQVILAKKESERDYQVTSSASNQYIPMTNLKSAKSQHGHKTKEMFRFNNGYLKTSNVRKQLMIDDSQSESTTMLPPIINQNGTMPENPPANPQNHGAANSQEQTTKREELIKKVVKNQQCRLQQHRILSGNFAQNTAGPTKINCSSIGQKYAISNLNSRAGNALGSRTQSQVKEYEPIKNKKNIFNANMNLSLKQPRVQKNHNEYGLTPNQPAKLRKQQSESSLRSQLSRHSRYSSNNDMGRDIPKDENMRYNHNQSSPQHQFKVQPKSQINDINSFYQNVSKKSYLNYNNNKMTTNNHEKQVVSMTSRVSVHSNVEKNTIEEASQRCFSGHLIESSVHSFQEHEDPHNETSQVPDDLEPKKDTHAQSLQNYQVNKKQGPSSNFFLKQASSFKVKEPSSAFKGSIASDFTLDKMDLQVTYAANTALNHQNTAQEQDRKFDQQLLNNAEHYLQAPSSQLISTISQKQRKSSPNLLLSAERRSRASRQQQMGTADKLKGSGKKHAATDHAQRGETMDLNSGRKAKNQSEMPSIQSYEKNSLVLNQNRNEVQQNPYVATKNRVQANHTTVKQKSTERSNTELTGTIKQEQKQTGHGSAVHKTPKDSKTERHATGLHHKKKLSHHQSPFKPESGHKYNHLLNKKQLQGDQPHTGKLVNKDYSPILSKSTQKMGKLVSKKPGKNDQIQQVHQNVYKSTKFAISKASRDSRMSGQKSSDQINQNMKIAPFQLTAQ